MTALLLNTKEWRAKGFAPITGQSPHETVDYGRGRVAYLWRDDQVRPLLRRTARPAVALEATHENVLAACWTVNRTAKRYRDAAARCYATGTYSFATANREKKEECYRRKDAALEWLIHTGAVECCGLSGVLTVWRGGGYTFHSLLGPEHAEPIPEGDDALEARKQAAEELRQRAARHAEILGDWAEKLDVVLGCTKRAAVAACMKSLAPAAV